MPSSAIRAGDYKLIEFYDDGYLELYNLAKDIGEKNNHAYKMPEMVKELWQKLDSWHKSIGAKMPTLNPDYDPERAGE